MVKGIGKWLFKPERGQGSERCCERCLKKMGVMNETKRAIMVFELCAVQVLVIAAGVAGRDGLVVFQKKVGVPHADRQEEKQEQAQAPEQAVCLAACHVGISTSFVFLNTPNISIVFDTAAIFQKTPSTFEKGQAHLPVMP